MLAAIFVGGFAGAVARAALAEALPADPGTWPWGTFVANMVGAFLLGYVATRLEATSSWRALLGPGLCGALTTFSTMQVELLDMFDDGRIWLALVYAVVSVAAGFAAVAVATGLARR